MTAELEIDAKAVLGEGAIWNHHEQTLWWVDIERKKLNFYDPVLKQQKSVDVDHRIGTVVPVEGGGALVALQNGIHFLDINSQKTKLLVNPLQENLRFNDGKCDPSGRFWVGTIGLDHKEGVASLYRLEHNGSLHKMIDGVTNSNGIVWSLDKSKMYYIDTPTKQVSAYNYDDKTGEISNPKTVISIKEGSPDGMTIDSEGMLWIALYGAGAVGRYNPESGIMLQKIDVPAKNVTSCAFGGKDLDILFITTALQGVDEEEIKKYPYSGGVFTIEVDIPGVVSFFFNKQF